MRAIVTVGRSNVRDFIPYLVRFDRTFRRLGCADMVIRWGSGWPPGSPSHQDCHYAFKTYAIQEAVRRGASSVLWLDSSCHAIRSLEPLWQKIEQDGCFLASGADRLGSWSSDRCLSHFGMSRDEAMRIPLLSGTFIGLDFKHPLSLVFLQHLLSLATPEHFNGNHRFPSALRQSFDPRVEGHRSDEPYMTLIARELGLPVYDRGDLCSGISDAETLLVRSGYDLPDDAPRQSLEVIHEHTIDNALVSGGGLVLDAGCRGFDFAREMTHRGCRVIALDPDPAIEPPSERDIFYLPVALASEPVGISEFVLSNDLQARHLLSLLEVEQAERVPVQVVTIEYLLRSLGLNIDKIGLLDCVKLDIEGSEYGVLRDWPGPIAKCITVEFHEHVQPQSQAVYDKIFTHLGKWYNVQQHEKTARHCVAPNYWDSLFTLREPWRTQARCDIR